MDSRRKNALEAKELGLVQNYDFIFIVICFFFIKKNKSKKKKKKINK
jgi:hypothetical protein